MRFHDVVPANVVGLARPRLWAARRTPLSGLDRTDFCRDTIEPLRSTIPHGNYGHRLTSAIVLFTMAFCGMLLLPNVFGSPPPGALDLVCSGVFLLGAVVAGAFYACLGVNRGSTVSD